MHQDTTWVPKTNQPRDNLQGSLHTWRFPTRPPCTPTVQGPNGCPLGSSIPPMVQSQHGCHSFLEPSNCWYWCFHSWSRGISGCRVESTPALPLAPLEAEAKAMDVAASFAWDMGIRDMVFETDSKVVSGALCGTTTP